MKTDMLHTTSTDMPPTSRMVVSSEMTLHRLLELFEGSSTRYLLVKDENEMICGIVDRNQVREFLEKENEVERARWEQLPVSSLAEPLSAGKPPHEDRIERHGIAPVATTEVRDDGGVAAIIRNGETFINWSRVNASIAMHHIDPVTVLPARIVFNRRIQEEVQRASRSAQSLALLLIDLDHFKEVNDQHGHRVGDLVLREVASSLRAGIRSYDFVARFGGDEFAVICTGCTPQNIRLPLQRLRDSHESRSRQRANDSSRVSLSIGAAVMSTVDAACSPEILVEQADLCLYHAKRGGRATAFAVELDPFGLPLAPAREMR